MRIFAGTDHMGKRSFIAVGSWIGIATALWVLAWVIASAIPVFENLLSLMVCPLRPLTRNYDADCYRVHCLLAGLVLAFPEFSGSI